MSTALRIARLAMRVLLGAVLSLVVLLSFASAVGIVRGVTVTSGSMRPSLPPGAVVFDRPVHARDIDVGDVITFTNPDGALTTHRVVALGHRSDGTVVAHTKGDANNTADAWQIPLRGTVWREVGAVPYIGYPLFALRHLGLFRILSVAFPIMLGAVWLVRIWSDDEAVGADA